MNVDLVMGDASLLLFFAQNAEKFIAFPFDRYNTFQWKGISYLTAKAFSDRNRLRRIALQYEADTGVNSCISLTGDELREFKGTYPLQMSHNISYLGLYTMEFASYFLENTV